MVALVFEVYGAVCFFSLMAFLVLASVAKLRPDLDEEHSKRRIQRLPHLIHLRKSRTT
jgi:hypothetical protein